MTVMSVSNDIMHRHHLLSSLFGAALLDPPKAAFKPEEREKIRIQSFGMPASAGIALSDLDL